MRKHDERPDPVARWDKRYAASTLVWSAGPNECVAAELGELPPGRALDLACGEGRNAIWLASRGWQVTGVDFSSVGIDKARRLAEQAGVQVDWQVGDVSKDLGAPGAYDLVLIAFLHTGPDERQRWLAAAATALKSGGTLLYVGHDRSNVGRGTGGPQDPAMLTTPEALSAALPGWQIVVARVHQRAVTNEPGHGAAGSDRVALDTLARAIKP